MSVFSQQADSVQQRRLDEVIIATEQPVRIAADAAAVQQLSVKQIATLPTLQLSDALKYMSGVVVKDYGGTGGMKTVSVRGLGAQHTGGSMTASPSPIVRRARLTWAGCRSTMCTT